MDIQVGDKITFQYNFGTGSIRHGVVSKVTRLGEPDSEGLLLNESVAAHQYKRGFSDGYEQAFNHSRDFEARNSHGLLEQLSKLNEENDELLSKLRLLEAELCSVKLAQTR